MATNYPGALDTTTNLPTSPDPFVANTTTGHLTHPPTVHGAVLALEAKVGSASSTPPSANGRYLISSSTGTTTWGPPRVHLIQITATTYTIASGDAGYSLEYDSTSAGTFTVPSGLPDGYIFEVVQLNTGVLTLAAGSGMTLLTSSTLVLRARYSTAQIRIRNSSSAIVAGDLA